MPFEVKDTEIEDMKLIIPQKFQDERGFFSETYRVSHFLKSGIDAVFQQDNQSFSLKGTLRGMHYQNPPHAQGKLVRVLKGKILDVGVDIRKGSPTYGKYVMRELSEENFHMLWIPGGFAHGFLALEDSTVFYKATSEYHKDSEGGFIWNDSSVGIMWPEVEKIISTRDQEWSGMDEAHNKFVYSRGR